MGGYIIVIYKVHVSAEDSAEGRGFLQGFHVLEGLEEQALEMRALNPKS